MILALLLACVPLSNEDLRPPPELRDADGDGLSPTDGDCDDTDPAVLPGAEEVPYDGVDGDCDPTTPDDDLDADGAPLASDCDDADPYVLPGARERCSDGRDDDCDGALDGDDPDCAPPGDGWIDLVIFPQDPRDGFDFCWGGGNGFDCERLGVDASGTDTLADLDDDGVPELLVGPFSERPTQVCELGAASPTCTELYGGRYSGPSGGDGVPGVGDLDGDGLLDVVLPGTHQAAPQLLCRQARDGTFACADAGTGIDGPDDVDLVDLDGDGDLDLTGSAPDVYALTVCLNEGGAFPACESRAWSWGRERLTERDLAADGAPELVPWGGGFATCPGAGLDRLDACAAALPDCIAPTYLSGESGLSLVCYRQDGAPTLCHPDGAGGYACDPLRTDPTPLADAALLDLDGDGALELLATSGTDLVVCESTGSTWDDCTTVSTGVRYYSISFGAFDFGAPPG